MKKRNAFVGAILSLMSFGQPLLIKTGVVLSATGLILSVPQKVYTQTSTFYFNRANDKANNGDHHGAILDYTKAIEINPNDAKAFLNRGYSKAELKNHYGAISDFTKAIRIDPRYADAYINRGIDKKIIGDLKGACADWQKASQLGDQEATQWVREEC